jgi:hypothetical protein
MAKSAMSQLEHQLEVIRKEAYDAGFAAAMQALREFAGRSPNTAAAAVVSRGRKVAIKPQSATVAKPKSTAVRKSRSKAQLTRPQRGSNALLITEVLKATHGPTRAADIRKALQRDKGVSIAFTSIRHALGQLAKRGEVKASADHKEWHYVGNGAD